MTTERFTVRVTQRPTEAQCGAAVELLEGAALTAAMHLVAEVSDDDRTRVYVATRDELRSVLLGRPARRVVVDMVCTAILSTGVAAHVEACAGQVST